MGTGWPMRSTRPDLVELATDGDARSTILLRAGLVTPRLLGPPTGWEAPGVAVPAMCPGQSGYHPLRIRFEPCELGGKRGVTVGQLGKDLVSLPIKNGSVRQIDEAFRNCHLQIIAILPLPAAIRVYPHIQHEILRGQASRCRPDRELEVDVPAQKVSALRVESQIDPTPTVRTKHGELLGDSANSLALARRVLRAKSLR